MTYYDQENQFLRQQLQKEIPILTALIQKLYQDLTEVSFERSKNTGNIWI